MTIEKKNILQAVATIVVILAAVVTATYASISFVVETKEKNKEQVRIKEAVVAHDKIDADFRSDLLLNLNNIENSIDQMKSTINGGKVIENSNGRRILIWKDKSAK
jgi:hypothetical protein